MPTERAKAFTSELSIAHIPVESSMSILKIPEFY